jgi:type IV secretory pathway TrbD component
LLKKKYKEKYNMKKLTAVSIALSLLSVIAALATQNWIAASGWGVAAMWQIAAYRDEK